MQRSLPFFPWLSNADVRRARRKKKKRELCDKTAAFPVFFPFSSYFALFCILKLNMPRHTEKGKKKAHFFPAGAKAAFLFLKTHFPCIMALPATQNRHTSAHFIYPIYTHLYDCSLPPLLLSLCIINFTFPPCIGMCVL